MRLNVDLSTLNRVDRLGVAACRLNHWEWDEILGPKPAGFDELPNFISPRTFLNRKKKSKIDYVTPAYQAIASIIGEHNISRCWWKYGLGKEEQEWFEWYVNEHIRSHHIQNRLSDE